MACSQSLFSILVFVAFALAKSHIRTGHTKPDLQQPANKGKVTRNYFTLSDAAELITNRSLRESVVIAQMFEWDWDSVAAECTSFLGPAGYGYVQGKVNKVVYPNESNLTSDAPPSSLADGFPISEPCAGTRTGYRMVDGLPARLVHPHVQTRRSIPVPGHDHCVSHGWRQSHSW